MSKSTDTNPVVTVVPNEETVEAKKPNFFQKRVVTPIKKHPKIASAIAGGIVLVGGAAYLGRATAPDASQFLEQSDSDTEVDSEESDTVTA